MRRGGIGRTALAGALLVVMAGCATAPAVGAARSRTVSADEARKQVEAVVEAQYAALEKGDVDGWAAALTPDAFFFGARPADALTSKGAAVEAWHVALDAALKGGGKLTVKSTQLQIGLSADGRAAWVSDVVELTLTRGEDQHQETQRLTEVVAEQDGQWWIYAVHMSIGQPNDQALAHARDGSQPVLPALSDSVAPGAQAVAAEFQKAVGEIGEFMRSVSQRPDALIFGTAPDESVLGGDKIREALGQQIHELGLRITRRGGLRAGVTPNGHLGWVASNIDLTAVPPDGDGHPVRLKTRGLLVYLNEGGLWRLVQGHFSNGAGE